MDELCPLPQPFTRAEALTSGLSARRLEAGMHRGTVTRLAPGLYALAQAWQPLTPWDRHVALARAASRVTPDAIVSHSSAAALLGLPMPPRPPERALMTLLDDTRTSTEDAWRRFHRGATPHEQIWIQRGRPVLVPARTVVDCVREMRPADALAVLDAAMRRGLVSGAGLRRMRRHQRRWPGIAVADALFELADGRRESWLESASAWTFDSWGLPPGIPQVVVRDPGGRFVARVDAAWPDLGLVGEADGRGKYLAGLTEGDHTATVVTRAVLRQVARESRLRELGLDVVRWDTDDAMRTPLALRRRWCAARDHAQPHRVRARFECSCCHRPLTDCESPTRMAPFRPGHGG